MYTHIQSFDIQRFTLGKKAPFFRSMRILTRSALDLRIPEDRCVLFDGWNLGLIALPWYLRIEPCTQNRGADRHGLVRPAPRDCDPGAHERRDHPHQD